MIAIFKREFKSYFINMSGYVFIGVLWLFSGIFATALNLIGQYAAYEYALSNLVTVLMLIVPILTMRSMSEDRRAKTDMLLYSLPVSSTEVILGKYFAMLAVWGVACLGMGATPVILGMFGAVNFASAYGALLGFFLLGAALIAVCTFVSSLTENQLIAAILGIEGANTVTDDWDNVSYKWRINEITPMGANIQLVFYRSKRNSDILVKVLHNEREQILDPSVATPVQSVYYRWEDIKEHLNKQMGK